MSIFFKIVAPSLVMTILPHRFFDKHLIHAFGQGMFLVHLIPHLPQQCCCSGLFFSPSFACSLPENNPGLTAKLCCDISLLHYLCVHILMLFRESLFLVIFNQVGQPQYTGLELLSDPAGIHGNRIHRFLSWRDLLTDRFSYALRAMGHNENIFLNFCGYQSLNGSV